MSSSHPSTSILRTSGRGKRSASQSSVTVRVKHSSATPPVCVDPCPERKLAERERDAMQKFLRSRESATAAGITWTGAHGGGWIREDRRRSCASQRSGSMAMTNPFGPAWKAAAKEKSPTLAPISQMTESGLQNSDAKPRRTGSASARPRNR